MQRSTVLFLLVGCTVAAVVAIFAFSGAGDVVVPPGGGSPAGNDPGPSGGTGGSGTAVSHTGGHQGTVPPDAPHVRIVVTSREKFVAPPTLARAIGADGRALSATVLAGVGAGFDAEPNRRGVALLAIDLDGGRVLRQVAIQPDEPDSARVGARVVMRGHVWDLVKKPIPGATVWLGEVAGDGTERVFEVDEEGAFEADIPAGEGVPFVVRAPGFASSWRTITVRPTSTALTEQLHPATTMTVQLAARSEGLDAVRVFVVPRAPVSTGVSQWPFFRQCLSGGYPVNAQGQAVIDDLPQHGTVGVRVRHPLAESGRVVPAKLTAQPVRITVPVAFGAKQLGVVVDAQGEPVAGASIWIRSPSQRLQGTVSSRLLPPHLDVRGVCYAQTDASGAFTVGLIDDDQAVMSIRALGFAGRDLPPKSFANTEVVLAAWLPEEAALRIQPPVPGKVWRVSINLGDGISENCAADEPFVIALPHAGRFDVEMAVEVAGQPRGTLDAKGLMVTGAMQLATPAPK